MVQWLAAQDQNQNGVEKPPRCARVQVVLLEGEGPGQLYDLLVDLDQSKVVKKEHLPGKHSHIDSGYMRAVEEACRNDPRVQAEIEKLNLPTDSTVCIEPWAYATDGEIDTSQRTTMVSPGIHSHQELISC